MVKIADSFGLSFLFTEKLFLNFKNREETEILPYLQINKLISYILIFVAR